MEETLHELGIEPSVLIIQVLGFLCLFLILKKYLFGMIGGAIEDRRREIRERMAKLEADQLELNQLHQEVKKRLTEIELEARGRIQAAVEQANTEREKLLTQAKLDADREVDKARAAIQREKNQALEELRGQVGNLSMQIAERILNETLDSTHHQRVINEFIAQLPSSREN